jgi:Co/Zn/Cd efflux system component
VFWQLGRGQQTSKAKLRTTEVCSQQGDDRIADLHVWRVGPGHHAAIVSLVSDSPRPVEDYKMRLADLARLSHITVEVHRCNHSH